jgi:hypothetical protein
MTHTSAGSPESLPSAGKASPTPPPGKASPTPSPGKASPTPPPGKASSSPRGPKRRRMSTQMKVALIGLVGALLAAVIGLFATDRVTVIVPQLGIGPDVVGTQEDNERLQSENDTLSRDAGALAAKNEDLKSSTERLEADNERLRGKLEEVGVDPDEAATTRVVVYLDRELELIGSEDGDRVAFLDLDTGTDDEMLQEEWEATAESGGPLADLAVWSPGGDYLSWSSLGVWSSKSGAPATPVSCEEKARASVDQSVRVDELAAGDVICLVTTDDALARIEIVSANSNNHPPSVNVNASVWK